MFYCEQGHSLNDHPCTEGFICRLINKDQASGYSIHRIRIKEDGFDGAEFHISNLIHFYDLVFFDFFQVVDVQNKYYILYDATDIVRRMLEYIFIVQL